VGFCQQVLEKCSKFSVGMGANVIGSAPNFLRTKETNICAMCNVGYIRAARISV